MALLVAEGKSNKEVAAALFLSPKTIEHHLGSIFRKRGFKRPQRTGQRVCQGFQARAPRRPRSQDFGGAEDSDPLISLLPKMASSECPNAPRVVAMTPSDWSTGVDR